MGRSNQLTVLMIQTQEKEAVQEHPEEQASLSESLLCLFCHKSSFSAS